MMRTPFWVGPVIALAVFVGIRFVVPPLFAPPGGRMGTELAAIGRMLAPICSLVVLVIWGTAEIKKRRRRKLLDSRTDIESLRTLSWREFEQLVGEAYRRQGYVVEETGGTADGGVDLVLRKAGETTLVQCKQWNTWKVGVTIVRELYGVMAAENAAHGVVVTCGRFTREAQAFAEGKALELVDGPALWRLVREAKAGPDSKPGPANDPPTPRRAERQPQATRAGDTPACPKCGSPMVLRTARRGPEAGFRFYGCSRYPACRGIRKLGASP